MSALSFALASCLPSPMQPDDAWSSALQYLGELLDERAPFPGESLEIQLKVTDGIIVLNDLSVWHLDGDSLAGGHCQIRFWEVGDAVVLRVLDYADAYAEIHHILTGRLMRVGDWRPVEGTYIGHADEVTVTGFGEDPTITFSDGSSTNLVNPAAVGWNIGDRVLLVRNGLPGEWYIHETTGSFIGFPLGR